jgi:hypothetical protein
VGRWSQSKRRGSTVPPAETLPAVPPPVLSELGVDLIQTSGAVPDVGGHIYFEEALSEEGPYTPRADGAWTAVKLWGLSGEFTGHWLRGSETGNGTTWATTRVYSEPYFVF